MLLAVDVGNTTISLGLFQEEILVEHWHLATRPELTPDELGLHFQGLLERKMPVDRLEGVIVSSVVPPLNGTLAQAFRRHLGQEAQFLDHRWGLVELRVDDPASVGPDRIADCLAGFSRYGGPLLIVDFGTATVFDLVAEDGAYLGGAIGPQMEGAAQALVQRAALLYEVELTRPPTIIGKNTADCLRAGFVLGFIDLVRGLIARFREEYRADLKVVATGGRGAFFAQQVPEIQAYEPHLTLHGLQIAWARRRERL